MTRASLYEQLVREVYGTAGEAEREVYGRKPRTPPPLEELAFTCPTDLTDVVGEASCPTCGRHLTAADLQTKRAGRGPSLDTRATTGADTKERNA